MCEGIIPTRFHVVLGLDGVVTSIQHNLHYASGVKHLQPSRCGVAGQPGVDEENTFVRQAPKVGHSTDVESHNTHGLGAHHNSEQKQVVEHYR